MTLEIGDDVQIKAGNLKGVVGRVLSRASDGRLTVDIDGATKTYGERSLSLVRAAAHIKRGDRVRRRAERNSPLGVVQSRGAMRAAVEWAGMPAVGIDIRQIEKAARRTPEGVAAEVAANPGPIVRDPQRPVLPTAAEVRNLSAAEAAALVRPAVLVHDAAELASTATALAAAGFVKCIHCPVWTYPDCIGAHEATHTPERLAASKRPDGRVYPLGRPESGEDARFRAGLWIDLVHTIEAAGYPRLGTGDLARLQSMLFRFIYDDGE
jgi:hypothetical protein